MGNTLDGVAKHMIDVSEDEGFRISNEKSVIALLFFITSFYLNFDKKLFSFVILLFLFYLLLLLIVYFSTPYELTYHLETSANRVLKSFTFLLAFFSLYNLNIRSFSKTS